MRVVLVQYKHYEIIAIEKGGLIRVGVGELYFGGKLSFYIIFISLIIDILVYNSENISYTFEVDLRVVC